MYYICIVKQLKNNIMKNLSLELNNEELAILSEALYAIQPMISENLKRRGITEERENELLEMKKQIRDIREKLISLKWKNINNSEKK